MDSYCVRIAILAASFIPFMALAIVLEVTPPTACYFGWMAHCLAIDVMKSTGIVRVLYLKDGA